MTTGLQAVALLTPVVTTNAIFSARRASKGLDAMDENPVYGAMNIDIAGGQVLKGSRAAMCFNPVLGESIESSLCGLTKSSKFANGVYKVLNLTADYINPIICLTSGVKVLGSNDKLDTAARESLSLATMFAFEGAAKRILGMPVLDKVNGKTVSVARESVLKNVPFVNKLTKSLNSFCKRKKLFGKIPLDWLPGALQGLIFVLSSISGYNLGALGGNKALGEKQDEAALNLAVA